MTFTCFKLIFAKVEKSMNILSALGTEQKTIDPYWAYNYDLVNTFN